MPEELDRELGKIEAVIAAAKTLRASLEKQERLSSRPFSKKVEADKNWLGMAIQKERHALHVAAVRADIAEPFSAEYYGERVFRPDEFHEYRVVFEHPLGGEAKG